MKTEWDEINKLIREMQAVEFDYRVRIGRLQDKRKLSVLDALKPVISLVCQLTGWAFREIKPLTQQGRVVDSPSCMCYDLVFLPAPEGDRPFLLRVNDRGEPGRWRTKALTIQFRYGWFHQHWGYHHFATWEAKRDMTPALVRKMLRDIAGMTEDVKTLANYSANGLTELLNPEGAMKKLVEARKKAKSA